MSLYIVVLVTASCFPRLPELADGGGGADGGAPPPFGLELLAGDIGGPGGADGTGSDAHFRQPFGAAIDSRGNVYVADQANSTIRKITPTGVVTTLAGTAGVAGNADGTGPTARFSFPVGVAVDSAGNVYVTDNQTIRKVTATGVVTTLAGTAGMAGNADGTGTDARFNGPAGMSVDGAGNIYVADGGNANIRKVTAAGVVTTLAGTAGMFGSADGTGAAARFYGPSGVAVDSVGNVYVADGLNANIRKVTAAGVVTTLAGTAGISGSADGTGAAARFNQPTGVAVDGAGNVYVADYFNSTVRKVTVGGTVTTLAGTAGMGGDADGMGATARFFAPTGAAVDSAGNVYVADGVNANIRKVTAAGVVTTLAGTAGMAGSADGTGPAARFYGPSGVAVDSAGNVYVADGSSTIRKVTAAGVVTTLAGTAGMSGSADGTGAAARFHFFSFGSAGAAVDSADNIYVADNENNTIRKVTAAGIVTTLAGTAGMSGSADGTGATARFYFPSGVAIDSAGNVYVADTNNCTIRKVTAAGGVTTLAGTGGMCDSVDGTGANARFRYPEGVAVDSTGSVYVADTVSSTIRKVTAAGVVTTLAGTPGAAGSADGRGADAHFNQPTAVAVDSAGNVYVTDQGNAIIRKVTPTGITTTVAGTAGMVGILLGGIPRFASPRSLAIVGDSIVLTDANAVLLLRHGAQ